jgi:hypothetical protein
VSTSRRKSYPVHNMNDGTETRNTLVTSGLDGGLSLWRLVFISSGNECERGLIMVMSLDVDFGLTVTHCGLLESWQRVFSLDVSQ